MIKENNIYYQDDKLTIYQGSNLDNLPLLPDNSVDSIVCDPPYELKFMNKGWDTTGIAFNTELWKQALRVLKPGGFLLAFGGSRTYHRMAVAIEDAGFRIKDQIMWLYGSGFPKALDIGKAIDKTLGVKREKIKIEGVNFRNPKSINGGKDIEGGDRPWLKKAREQGFHMKDSNEPISNEAKQWATYKTALKPAHEPIVMAQKPLEKGLTYAKNVLKWGVGALNIDESRVKFDMSDTNPATNPLYRAQNGYKKPQDNGQTTGEIIKFTNSQNPVDEKGRFPANVIHDGSEEVINSFPNGKSSKNKELGKHGFIFQEGKRDNKPMAKGYDDSGSAARFFYGAKAQKKDRDQGLGGYEDQNPYPGNFNGLIDKSGKKVAENVQRKNIHPTVKTTDLMRYLVRMVTPKNGTVVDIFLGSGSTLKGAMVENILNDKNYKMIGFELTEEYLPIARDRILKGSIEYVEEELKKKNKKTKLTKELKALW